ncbi:MAG TPA: 3-hydroxyacyl-CoA dehydrogenase NAD-binding domain-containing protein [Rhodanobacter sp.]|nr:3-hydroxyacyl-CoA dehydrogenase NAD-binding domain-containing protein [Rhodanobacter sp.]
MTELGDVGAIGVGVMRRGLAQDLAQHGYKVRLIDVDGGILAGAKRSIRQSLRGAYPSVKGNAGMRCWRELFCARTDEHVRDEAFAVFVAMGSAVPIGICHIKPDSMLLYRKLDDAVLRFMRIGFHGELGLRWKFRRVPA